MKDHTGKAEDKKQEMEKSPARSSSAGRFRAAVITLSDKGAAGQRTDESGPLICRMLKESGYDIVETLLLPDEKEQLKAALIRIADGDLADLILTTGGTGFSPRDTTPEATMEVAHRNAPGIAAAMLQASLLVTPRAMLSRAASVIRERTLIVNLPGSPKAVRENLSTILPTLGHGLGILKGREGECGNGA